jgi:hypothetical protein
MVAGAFGVAIVFRKQAASLAGPVIRAVTVLVIAGGGIVMTWYTFRYLGITSLTSEAIVKVVNDANQSTQGSGAGYGSSHSSWHISPLYYPYDIVLVLAKPLPWEVASFGQALSALENVSIMALLALSWRSLVAVPGQLRRSPYTLMALAYSVVFIYLFSALANVGLLVRERTLLFPFLFVLLALVPWGGRAPGREGASAQAATPAARLARHGSYEQGVHHGP